jgi:hypothetical protein
MVHVDPGVYDHQKTKAAARQLGLNPCKVVYHLTMMWAMAHRRKTGGMVIDLKPNADEAVITFNRDVGYAGGSMLLVVLKQVGFLDARGSTLWAHDWDDWQPSRARRSGSSGLSPDSSRSSLSSHSGSSGEIARQESLLDTTGAQAGSGEGGSGGGPLLPPELRGTNYFGQFMWWLVQGFGFHEYDKSADDPGYFKRAGKGVNIALAAEAYIAIATGKWGDDFDRRALSGRHALRKVSAFGAFKRRRSIDTLIPLTAIGARYHPTAGRRSGGMGTGDAGAVAAGTGNADPFANGDGSFDLGNHPKYGGS